jgi:hypothetical protein
VQTVKFIIFTNILGYPGGKFRPSFIFNNIVGYTFILSFVSGHGFKPFHNTATRKAGFSR